MAYAFNKAKILIIDDMKPMLMLTSSLLKIFGFQDVYTATDGDTAFDLLCKHDPDLVITDWVMAPMDGLEFTKKVRRDPLAPNPYVPIIMMTGFSSRLRVEKARDIGVTEFLVKPFSARDLYTRMTQIIEKPRQFVDAGTFFGPDRRRKLSNDYEGPRRREKDQGQKPPASGEEEKEASTILKKLREEARQVSD